MSEAPDRPRRRIALRLSLGGLMLLIVGLAAWLGWVTNGARTQQKAVEAILARGGVIEYAHQYVGPRLVKDAEPPGPKWLRRRIGDDYFQTPIRAFLYRKEQQPNSAAARRSSVPLPLLPHDDDIMTAFGSLAGLERMGIDRGPATDAGLSRLRGLPHLRYLYLMEAGDISDAGLAHLAGMRDLEFLSLWYAQKITDAGIAHLAGLKKLNILAIRGGTLTDPSLEVLGELTDLEELELSCLGGFSDAGLAHLAGLKKLMTLSIPAEQATDAGLAHLAGLNRLTTLRLVRAQLTGEGLAHLRGLPQLDNLTLNSTRLTAEGLGHLVDLPSLRTLSLSSPSLADAALDALGRADQLTTVTLICPSLTDDQLAHLATMKHLKGLLIRINENLTDRAVENLRGLDSLESLSIIDNTPNLPDPNRKSRITDRGLEAIAAFPKLKSLMISSPEITKAAVARLRKARPELRVSTPSSPAAPTRPRPAAKKADPAKKAPAPPR